MRIWPLVIVLMLVIVSSGAVIWLLRTSRFPEAPVIQFIDRPLVTNVRTTVQSKEQTYTCERGQCAAKRIRAGAPDSAIAGDWTYFYADGGDDPRGLPRVALRRRNLGSGEIETIMEATPLTRPRGVYPYSAGTLAAFWLDNTDQPRAELTELWLFDSSSGAVRVVAEKLYRPDIRSEPRWNSAGTHILFVADTGDRHDARDRLAIVSAEVASGQVAAAFADPSLAVWQENFAAAPFDLATDGAALAYSAPTLFGREALVIRRGTARDVTTLSGSLKHVEWLSDGSLVYIVQARSNFAVWRVTGSRHRLVGQQAGMVRAARSSAAGDYLVVAVVDRAQRITVQSHHLLTGTLVAEGGLVTPPADDIDLRIVRVDQLEAAVVAEGVIALDDAVLTAFVQAQVVAIADDPTAIAMRLVTTDARNTVFLEYQRGGGRTERVLLVIRDAVHPEWVLRARYEERAGTWFKVEGSRLPDPAPHRLYEWEPELQQWILKADHKTKGQS